MQVHSNGPKDQKEASEGGDWTIKGYHALVKTDRWKKKDGADFVWFDPHPGFTDGTSDKPFKELMCHTSKKSMHIVVERGQINICPVSPPLISRHPSVWQGLSACVWSSGKAVHILLQSAIVGARYTQTVAGFAATREECSFRHAEWTSMPDLTSICTAEWDLLRQLALGLMRSGRWH